MDKVEQAAGGPNKGAAGGRLLEKDVKWGPVYWVIFLM